MMNIAQPPSYLILIPSFEPDQNLTAYVHSLLCQPMTEVIVVDDGSGARYADIFMQLRKMGVVVLSHPCNLGKGQALKTGYRYIKEQLRDYACIVTADSDGQHAVSDVMRLAHQSEDKPNALILGTRDFRKAGVPRKSRWGNHLSSAGFALLYGKWLSDTQTGLRAFGPLLLDLMIKVNGNRFEYEMQVLITCTQLGVPLVCIPIQTIYTNANQGSHYHPWKDSIRILRVLGLNFLKFSASSAISAVVDLTTAWLFLDLLYPFMIGHEYSRILLATVGARFVSLLTNYLLNRRLVFKPAGTVSPFMNHISSENSSQSDSAHSSRQTDDHSLTRYLILSLLLIILSSGGVYLLHNYFDLNEKLGKIVCDVALFFLSYQLQIKWVFRSGGGRS
ncbi:glycosyltransferase [Oscillospiraceae bacterium HV4-5-C5C]|nr:glycosyltransferase [Oscillospiraceae bacterium HV4-5-C5C]